MRDVFICDAARTAIGRYGGALAKVRTDDLAAVPIKALVARNDKADWSRLDEVVMGCANQSGEDNRNVASMALLLSGIPHTVPGVTVNRLCASGMEAVATAARAIAAGEMSLAIAGGVESMSRAPFVMGKATTAFARNPEIFDTTLGWRFINPLLQKQYGTDSMAETAENVAEDYKVDRARIRTSSRFGRSRGRGGAEAGFFAEEIVPVVSPGPKGGPIDGLRGRASAPRHHAGRPGKAPAPFRNGGTVTAGNASGINDGAAAMILACEDAVNRTA